MPNPIKIKIITAHNQMSENPTNIEETTITKRRRITHHLSLSEELPTTTTGLTKARKLQLFALICMVLYLTFVSTRLPNVYLPLYNEEHNVTTAWTGVMMGSGEIRHFVTF